MSGAIRDRDARGEREGSKHAAKSERQGQLHQEVATSIVMEHHLRSKGKVCVSLLYDSNTS